MKSENATIIRLPIEKAILFYKLTDRFLSCYDFALSRMSFLSILKFLAIFRLIGLRIQVINSLHDTFDDMALSYPLRDAIDDLLVTS